MSVHEHPALAGLSVLERGWLSSNNIVIHPQGAETGAVLIDTGHVTHGPQTAALVALALHGTPLDGIVNTHLHADHCGGNAALQRAFGAPVLVPPGQAEAARQWDVQALSFAPMGQLCERFNVDGTLAPGDVFNAGGRDFEVLAAPGHDPHAVLLFDAGSGLLITADALWEDGFGAVFPELEGERAFADVAAVFDLIERLPVSVVVPGHGAPFTDVRAALARARSRLQAFEANPARHHRHAAKVMLSFHLMEVQGESLTQLRRWIESTQLFTAVWLRVGHDEAPNPIVWGEMLLRELVVSGAVRWVGERISVG